MNKLFQNTAFNLGFYSGLCLFAFVNYLSYVISYNEFINREMKFSAGGYRYGFPFTLYQEIIGYPNSFDIIWSGVIANAVVALIGSFLIGLIFKIIWSRITTNRLH